MYNIIAAQENIFYIKNCISYPNKYVELIENLNNQEESYKYIPEWKLWTASNDLKTIYGIKKQININNVIENLKLDLEDVNERREEIENTEFFELLKPYHEELIEQSSGLLSFNENFDNIYNNEAFFFAGVSFS